MTRRCLAGPIAGIACPVLPFSGIQSFVPSIINSPAAPGINPNFDTTIRLRDPYFVAAGTTYYTTSLELMFMREDYTATGGPLDPSIAPDGRLNRLENVPWYVTAAIVAFERSGIDTTMLPL